MSDKEEDIETNSVPVSKLKSIFESNSNDNGRRIFNNVERRKGIYEKKNHRRPPPPPLMPKPPHLRKIVSRAPPVPKHQSLPHLKLPHSASPSTGHAIFNFDKTLPDLDDSDLHNRSFCSNTSDVSSLDLSSSGVAESCADCSSSEGTISDQEDVDTNQDESMSYEEPHNESKDATLHTAVINRMKEDLSKMLNHNRPLPPVPPHHVNNDASNHENNGLPVIRENMETADKEKKRSSDYLKTLVIEWAMTEERLVKEVEFIVERYPKYLKECDLSNVKYPECIGIVNQIIEYLQPVLRSHMLLFEILRNAVYNWDSQSPNLSQQLLGSVSLLNHSIGYLQRKAVMAQEFKRVVENNAEFEMATTRFVTKFLNDKNCFYSEFRDLPGAPNQLDKNQGISMLHYLDIVHQNTMRWTLFSSKYHEAIGSEIQEKKLAYRLWYDIDSIVAKMNQKIDRNQNVSELIKLQLVFDKKGRKIDCFEPGRWLLKDGFVKRITRKELSDRRLILFNDVLLVCHPELDRLYDIRPDKMEVKADESIERETCFTFFSQQKSTTIVCETKMERDEWVKLFNEAIEHTKNINRRPRVTNTRMDGVDEKPFSALWILDHEASMCMIEECSSEFGVFTRRHHCRNCGYVICRLCSGYAPVKSKDLMSERVCAACYHEIINEYKNGTLFPKEMLLWNSVDPGSPPYSIDSSEPRIRVDGKLFKPKELFVPPKHIKYHKKIPDLDQSSDVLAYGTINYKGSGYYARLTKTCWLRIYKARFDPKPSYTINLSGFSYNSFESDKLIKLRFSLQTGKIVNEHEFMIIAKAFKVWKSALEQLNIKENNN